MHRRYSGPRPRILQRLVQIAGRPNTSALKTDATFRENANVPSHCFYRALGGRNIGLGGPRWVELRRDRPPASHSWSRHRIAATATTAASAVGAASTSLLHLS